jgi:hypothetical protein
MRSAAKLVGLICFVAVSMWPQQSQPVYQVLHVPSDDALEAKINETAAQGFTVAKFVLDPRFQYVVVFRRTEGGEAPAYRIFSRTVSDGKNFKPSSTVQKSLSDIGAGGYRVVPRSAVLCGQQLLILLKHDQFRWDYRLTKNTKGKDLDRELADLGLEGFQPIEFLPHKPFRSVLLEKQGDATDKRLPLRTSRTDTPEELTKRLPDFGSEGYRADVVSDDFDLVLRGGNPPLRDANVILEGRANDLSATLSSASGKKLHLLLPVASNRDRRGMFRGMHHTVGGVFERSGQDYEYRVLRVADLNRFSRDLNELQTSGWELIDLFTHWDPSADARMLAILERQKPAAAK